MSAHMTEAISQVSIAGGELPNAYDSFQANADSTGEDRSSIFRSESGTMVTE